ncbi:MAG: hypothetical protein ABIJ48_10080 [Actinomycetota bacterium]
MDDDDFDRRQEALEAGPEAVRGDHWSKNFSRSDLGANVFACRLEWLGDFLNLQGFAHHAQWTVMGPFHESLAFADGGRFLRHRGNSIGGFGVLAGQWIVGFAAFRHVCTLLGLVPPRLLKGEQSIPDPQLLAREVQRQKTEDRKAMEARAELLLTPETAVQHTRERCSGTCSAAPSPVSVWMSGTPLSCWISPVTSSSAGSSENPWMRPSGCVRTGPSGGRSRSRRIGPCSRRRFWCRIRLREVSR